MVRALKAGACGYLLKSALRKELLSTIRAVHAGRKALSPEVTYEVAEHVGEESLSPMEVRVLQMVADGNSNKEIAAKLAVSEEAVKGRFEISCRSWAPTTARHAAVLALKRGIII